jgi:hypothetical protein
MKHNITLSLQQITDLEVIHNDLVTRGDIAYRKANGHAFAAGENRRAAAAQDDVSIARVWLDEAEKHESRADDRNAEGDRLMTQATVVHSIISQIKKNG